MKKYIIAVCLIVVVAGAAVGAYLGLHKSPLIPPAIKKQVAFVIYYPNKTSGVQVDSSSFKYDNDSKVLSFKATGYGVKMTIGEQPTPQGFIDIPQAYDKLIEDLNGYSEFGSYYGTIDLLHPKEFKGQQSAALNAKGTLMFVHPTNGSLNKNQWQQFFNTLQLIQ